MRQCTRCGFAGEDVEFAICQTPTTGTCKRCKSEYNKSWYHRNKEKHIADVVVNNKRYSDEGKTKYVPRTATQKESDRRSREKSRVRLDAANLCIICWIQPRQSKTRCKGCLEHSRQQRQDPQKRAAYIVTDSRHSDRRYGFVTDLTLHFVEAEIAKGCIYCGEKELLMTLDRIDNSKGHTQDNVLPACLRCNYARRDMPYEAWLKIAPGFREAREEGLFGTWTGRSKSPRNSAEE